MIKLFKENAEFYIPDGLSVNDAIKKTTHMAIAAHQDDVEIMAYDGIKQCLGNNSNSFFAVVVTNGAGSARNGMYSDFTDEQMQQVRKKEQKKAAYLGDYGALALLDYSSSEIKKGFKKEAVNEISELIKLAYPKVLYTHNLADKHDTHIAVVTKVIEAVRQLPLNKRPQKVYGCEVWRDLDWLLDEDKIIFDVSGNPNLESALVEVFDSQICGGKRYDLACIGRRKANATYLSSHSVDNAESIIFGMDLTPLIENETLDICDFTLSHIEKFKKDVGAKIKKYL